MRFNLVGNIIGQRGTGKSLFVIGSEYAAREEDKKLNIPGVFNLYLNTHKMKVIIIDTLDHPAYRNIPILEQVNVLKWNSGVVRVFMKPETILKFVDFINQTPHFNNTLIIFEDAVKYIGSRLSDRFKNLIVDSKQRNIDIIFMFHCFIDTPTNLFTKSDFIQLFKTEDSPLVRKNNLRLFDKVWAAYEEVRDHENNFFGNYIDTRTN